MTTPVSLPVMLPLPGLEVGPVPDPAIDDVFASLLAALSTAMGLPAPVVHGATIVHGKPEQVSSPCPGPATPVTAPDVPAQPSPVVWTAVTQRVALPDTTQPDKTQPDKTQPDRALAAPRHVEGPSTMPHGAAVRETTPAALHAPRPAALAPAVPEVQQAVPEVAATPAPTPTPDLVQGALPLTPTAAPSTAPPSPPTAEPLTPTRQVTPELVAAAHGLRHEGGGRTSLVVRLDPPELGAVLVKLTVQDGRVDVQLRTPDLAARTDLQAQSYNVEQVLREQGFDLRSFDVQQGGVLSDSRGDAPDRGTRERHRPADGHPTHSPVTDDGPAPEPSGTWL